MNGGYVYGPTVGQVCFQAGAPLTVALNNVFRNFDKSYTKLNRIYILKNLPNATSKLKIAKTFIVIILF